jgi:hypothetical protein
MMCKRSVQHEQHQKRSSSTRPSSKSVKNGSHELGRRSCSGRVPGCAIIGIDPLPMALWVIDASRLCSAGSGLGRPAVFASTQPIATAGDPPGNSPSGSPLGDPPGYSPCISAILVFLLSPETILDQSGFTNADELNRSNPNRMAGSRDTSISWSCGVPQVGTPEDLLIL